MRVSAPHHAESHGAIEKFDQTYTRTLKTFGDPSTWRNNYAAANEAYNRSVHRLLSAAGMPLSPIEVWRLGQIVSPYLVPETATNSVCDALQLFFNGDVSFDPQVSNQDQYAAI